jgi:hypothetical protein
VEKGAASSSATGKLRRVRLRLPMPPTDLLMRRFGVWRPFAVFIRMGSITFASPGRDFTGRFPSARGLWTPLVTGEEPYWNFGKRDDSLKFFADCGHRQIIAGYYDAGPDQIKPWLESAAKVKGVIGLMYTTWANKYDDLEAFAKACRP